MRPTVAVIGAGVSGLTAAYVLRHSHDVTLFEADQRLGGHAHTHDVLDPGGRALSVDTGFIVHNASTYPTLLRLFDELGVATRDTEMSMSVSCAGCGLEYAGGRGVAGIVARARFLARPAFVRMLLEVRRFHAAARAELASEGPDRTLAEFLEQGRYSPYVRAHFVTPLVAAVWSSAPATALQYPARYLFAFLANHGMLSVGGSLQWRTVVGGSREYVERAVKEVPEVRTGDPVRSVARHADGVDVVTGGQTRTFRQVVVATHPDQALALLGDPTPAQRELLGAFRYTANPAVLHTDPSVLPAAPRARSSWNYRMASCTTGIRDGAVEVSYDLTRLQGLPGSRRYFATLNAPVRPERVLARMDYRHPAYTPASVAAQARLPQLNDGVTAFAGAYHGWGFHEDGARSGLAAAQSLGGAW